MRLLLASKSSARRAMLEAADIPFGLVEAELEEEQAKAGLWGAGFDALGVAEELAQLKALSASGSEGDLILGADQTLERGDGTMLSKPASRDEARGQLHSLRGTTHQLHTAAVIAEDGQPVWWGSERVRLTMRHFSDAFLDDYLAREWESIRWSVGGYRIEGPGVQLFEKIEGSHFAILGLPLLPLLDYLRQRGLVRA
ncbi:MAG: Maf-like protein [Alphaproteobacteria bacterium]|nr:Maf-like protein [Alphaproteobacteria bacterium]